MTGDNVDLASELERLALELAGREPAWEVSADWGETPTGQPRLYVNVRVADRLGVLSLSRAGDGAWAVYPEDGGQAVLHGAGHLDDSGALGDLFVAVES